VPDSVLFDRYELIEPAGRGSSAEVWRARDRRTGETVAVKRLHPLVVADESARRRLEREFHLLHGLDEPHVARVRELRIEDREAALILDYVDGESLASRLAALNAASERMPLAAGVAVVADVAAALAAAHAAGLVHRDVTPANILLGRDGQAYLTDFGIAHATGDATMTAVTATGLVLGTMRYLAPEQLRGDPATPSSDLHALAAVAYEIAAGRPAYGAPTPIALADAQRAGPSPIGDVPAGVDAVVRRGLDPDPGRRQRDVGTFAAELAAAAASGTADEPTIAIALPAIADDTAVASPSRAAASGVAVAAPIAPRVERVAPMARRRDRRRLPGAVVAAVGLVLGILVIAAANGVDGLPAAYERASPSAVPAASRPAVTPTPAPTKVAKPNGEGHGNGKDHGGKGHD
jgi:serine/threonine-protein kinase